MLKNFLRMIAVATCLSTSLFVQGAGELDALKSNTDRWIEIRSRISKETSDWKIQREVLLNGIDTLESSKEALEGNVAFHIGASQELTELNQEAEQRQANFEQTNELLLTHLVDYEKRVVALVDRLPDPLVDELRQLVVKIPSGEGATDDSSLPNRLQNLVAIMTMIDEFNNKLHLIHTIKELENGEFIEVRVLYWGLSVGYASDSLGTRAWQLNPGSDGWIWASLDGSASAVKRLFDVYDKILDPELVNLPVATTN